MLVSITSYGNHEIRVIQNDRGYYYASVDGKSLRYVYPSEQSARIAAQMKVEFDSVEHIVKAALSA